MASEVKKVTLRSSDGELFEVDQEAVIESKTIMALIEDDCYEDGIPLPNVTGEMLAKVMEYLKNHAGKTKSAAAAEEFKAWVADFVKVDQAVLLELLMAANYLNIGSLVGLACETAANMIKETDSPDEIRRIFNIKNDFTPEEEAEVRGEDAWAFE